MNGPSPKLGHSGTQPDKRIDTQPKHISRPKRAKLKHFDTAIALYYYKRRAYTCCCWSRAPPADDDAPALQAGHCLIRLYPEMLQKVVPYIGDEPVPAARYSLLRSRSKQTSHAKVSINKRSGRRKQRAQDRAAGISVGFGPFWFGDSWVLTFWSIRVCPAACFCGFSGFSRRRRVGVGLRVRQSNDVPVGKTVGVSFLYCRSYCYVG